MQYDETEAHEMEKQAAKRTERSDGSQQRVVSQPRRKIETFEDSVAFARELMLEGGKAAAKQLGIAPPTLREEKTITGLRLVVVWPDGAETNECVIQRIDDQTAMAG